MSLWPFCHFCSSFGEDGIREISPLCEWMSHQCWWYIYLTEAINSLMLLHWPCRLTYAVQSVVLPAPDLTVMLLVWIKNWKKAIEVFKGLVGEYFSHLTLYFGQQSNSYRLGWWYMRASEACTQSILVHVGTSCCAALWAEELPFLGQYSTHWGTFCFNCRH